MSGRFSADRVLQKIVPIGLVGLFVSFFAVALIWDLGDDWGDSGFDHYRTDIDIIVGSDGTIIQTEKYWFRWEGVRSGEMYLSKDAHMGSSINVIGVSIDGHAMAKATSYLSGRIQTDLYPDGSHGWWYYEGYNFDTRNYEINAFYPYETAGEHIIEFEYEVTGAVTKYADCVDFYYKVYDYFSEDLKNLTVNVIMPAGSLREETYIFGHGDPNGWCEFVDSSGNSVFKSTELLSYTMFEIRVVSKQTSLFSMPAKTGQTFDSILAYEKSLYDRTQLAAELSKYQPVIVCLMALLILFHLLFGKRLVKRNKPAFNQPYMRDVPTLKPNIVATVSDYYKAVGGKMGNKVTATVLNLALQKIIAIEKGDKNDPVFVSLNSGSNMTTFERSVYDLIFRNSPGPEKKRVALSEVKKAMSGYSEYGQRISASIISNDKNEFAGHNFAERDLGSKFTAWKIAISLGIVVLAVLNFAFTFYTENFEYVALSMFVGFIGLILILVRETKAPLTARGEDERAKALALKRFYTDMTMMKERRAIELPVWEQHLVYATALGVADKVVKELNVRLQELPPSSPYIPAFVYMGMLSQFGNISGTFSSVRSVPLSSFQNSSGGGGGGGGGFSGGGGGGFGGGGGGHR